MTYLKLKMATKSIAMFVSYNNLLQECRCVSENGAIFYDLLKCTE